MRSITRLLASGICQNITGWSLNCGFEVYNNDKELNGNLL